MIRNADLALYRAKDGSGNDIRFYEPGLHARAEERRKLELALRGAIDKGEFSLDYQPVVDAQTRADQELRGAAALAQSRARPHSARPSSSRSPRKPAARPDRRMGAAHRLPRGRHAGPRTSRVAVNVSPRQLRDPGFIVTLVSALTQARLAPEPARARGDRDACSCELHRRHAEGPPADPEPRRDARHGRFRHRLFLARLSAPRRFRHAQDRPQLRLSPSRRRIRRAPRSSAPSSRWPAASA